MPEDNIFAARGRAFEDDYFREQDRQLIEKMQHAAAAEDARQELERQTGVVDAELVDELQQLGVTPDTASLVPLIPLVQMAWAEGEITSAERELLVQSARVRGIGEGSVADRQLAAWMTRRPDDVLFAKAGRLVAATLTAGTPQAEPVSAEALVAQCEAIARASGGIFGIGRISAEERALLSAIVEELRTHRR
jgi:hypothetical protein